MTGIKYNSQRFEYESFELVNFNVNIIRVLGEISNSELFFTPEVLEHFRPSNHRAALAAPCNAPRL